MDANIVCFFLSYHPKQPRTMCFSLHFSVLLKPDKMQCLSSHSLPQVTVMKSDVKKHLDLLGSILLVLWKQLLQYTAEMIKGQHPHVLMFSFHHITQEHHSDILVRQDNGTIWTLKPKQSYKSISSNYECGFRGKR